jgi:hypothetical protein
MPGESEARLGGDGARSARGAVDGDGARSAGGGGADSGAGGRWIGRVCVT